MPAGPGSMAAPPHPASSTPSRIPVLARKCPPLPAGGSPASGLENRDPEVSVSRAGPRRGGGRAKRAGGTALAPPRPKGPVQTVSGARLPRRELPHAGNKLGRQALGREGSSRARAPLEEISPASMGQNVSAEPRPKPADPGDLAVVPSKVEVTSGGQGCQTGLAQRVLVLRNQNQKSSSCELQSSAKDYATFYATFLSFAPKHTLEAQTPGLHPRSPLLSRNQKSAERNIISQTQVSSDSGQPQASTKSPVHQPLREPAIPAYSAVPNSSQSRREARNLAQRVLLKGAHEAPLPMDGFPWTSSPLFQFTPGQVGHSSPFGRVPVTHSPALTSYSVLRHLSVFSKTPQATPAPTPRAQQEQIVVKQLYEESWESLEEEPEKPSSISPLKKMSLELSRHEVGPGDVGVLTPSNRMSLELSKPTVGSRDVGVAAPSNKMSLELNRHEMDPTDVGVASSSNRMSLELSRYKRINILKQLLQEEVEGLVKIEDSHKSDMSQLKMIEPKLAMIPCTMEPSNHASELPNLQGPKQHPDVGEPISTGGPGIQGLIQQSNFGMCATTSTNLTFFQCPLCGSIPLHSLGSLRSPMGTIGPAVLALRRQLNAWLEAVRLLYEGCLDDECAFYTGQGIPGPQRICKNPVATWLERQEAMDFVPISSPAP